MTAESYCTFQGLIEKLGGRTLLLALESLGIEPDMAWARCVAWRRRSPTADISSLIAELEDEHARL